MTARPFHRFLRAFAPLCLLALLAAALLAQPAQAAKEIFGPVYNPKTRSYFALIDLGYHGGGNWEKVSRIAAGYQHKGVKGRLAVVPDRETHRFLTEHFAPHIREPSWIGLRYFCAFRKLMWVDGTVVEQSPAGVWHPRWHRTGITCQNNPGLRFMPVYMMRTGATNVRWQASGENKFFDMMVVEYPTGRP